MIGDPRRLFTIPRVSMALLGAGALLTILAVSAAAREGAGTPAGDPAEDGNTDPAVESVYISDATPRARRNYFAQILPTATPEASGETGGIEPPPDSHLEEAQAAAAGGRFALPLSSWTRVTDRYGAPRGPNLIHGGIDLAVGGNVPILSSCEGVVTVSEYSSVYGNFVIVDCGDGWTTLYGHLSSLTVLAGDAVKQGTGLGLSGSTGFSTGEHLHFEIHYRGVHVNPEHYLDFQIPPGTPLSDGPIVFPRAPHSAAPSTSSSSGTRTSGTSGGGSSTGGSSAEPTAEPTATSTATATATPTETPTPTATPTVTNTPTPTPTPQPPTATPTPTPRPVSR